MQLGKALVGALIGGVAGIVALIGIYSLTGWDKAWLAILVAVLTGLGVRWFASVKGHPSYARGGLTAVIAILAFLAWYPIVAQITVRGAVAKPIVADRAEGAIETEAPADVDAVETAPLEESPRMGGAPNVAPGGLARPGAQQSTWDLIWLCIAGLIAYELGRGTSAAAPSTGMVGSPDDGAPVPSGQA